MIKMAAIKQADGGDRSNPASKKTWGKHQAGSQMLPAHRSRLSQKFALDELLTRRLPAPGNKTPHNSCSEFRAGLVTKMAPFNRGFKPFPTVHHVSGPGRAHGRILRSPLCRSRRCPSAATAAPLPGHPRHGSAVTAHLEDSQPGDIRRHQETPLNFVSLWERVATMTNVHFPRTQGRPVPNSSFIVHPAAPSAPARLLLGAFYVDLHCWR